MKLIGYVRVSTEDQSREGISLAAQEAAIRHYAATPGQEIELVAIETDAGISAKTITGRPGLLRALAMLDRGEADGVVVVKLDRLTRSVRNLGELIDGPFKTAALVSLGEKIDTTSAGGRMIVNLLATVSQWEREVGAERTRAAMGHLRAMGRLVGGVPYGQCVVIRDGKKWLADEPAEQLVLAEARRLRASGLSLRAVASELERAGHLNRSGRRFNASEIQTMTQAAT